jgi:hypothetical protein
MITDSRDQCAAARPQAGRGLARRRAGQRLAAPFGRRRRQGGPRFYDWAYLPYRSDTASGWQKGLLIRRKIKQPTEFTCYLTLSPAATTLAELVRVAGRRWTVEICFKTAKGEVGLDQYEVRSWGGWHRHITLALLAHAYLAVLRKTAVGEKIRSGSRHRARFAAGAAAPHPTRTAPADLASGLGAPARSRTRPRLVGVAATSAAHSPLPLETTKPFL